MNDESIVPSRFTISVVLLVVFFLAMMGDLNNGKIIHGFAMKMGCDSRVFLSNSLIDMYGKCKCIEDALEIFEMMKGRIYSHGTRLYLFMKSVVIMMEL